MNTDQLSNGTTFLAQPEFLGHQARDRHSWLRVEPVEGGFIVERSFPDGSITKSVASNGAALARLLRQWSERFAKPKKDA